jgi:hypothetical protein
VIDLGKALERRRLARLPLALGELHDRHPKAVTGSAHRQAEARRALALAVAGVDDQQTLIELALVARLVLLLLDLDHAPAVRFVDLVFAELSHEWSPRAIACSARTSSTPAR